MNKAFGTSKIVIPCFKTIEFVLVSDIIRLEALQNYTRFYLVGNIEIVSMRNLGSYRLKLEEYGFYLCHKSYLIQLDMIVRYHKNGYIEMQDGVMIPIARRRRDAFINEVLDLSQISTI